MATGIETVCWASKDLPEKAEATGYARLQGLMKTALKTARIAIDEQSPIALHVCPPFNFIPVTGKLNALLTMWEGESVPPEHIARINLCDILLVPCVHNAALFSRCGVTRPRIELCPLGIDTAFWTPPETEPPRKPFTFLYCANPLSGTDDRKGKDRVQQAFRIAFNFENKDVKLYVKFNPAKGSSVGKSEYHDGSIVIDNRYIPLEELRELYRSAHVFVYPSRGEGFGFLPAEAMACGTLVLAPPHTGMKDFVSEHTAIPLKTTLQKNAGDYGGPIDIWDVHPGDLRKALRDVRLWYGKKSYQARRRAGQEFIRNYHSIETMGQHLKSALFEDRAPEQAATG